MKHSVLRNYFPHWSKRIPGLSTSPDAVRPHCSTRISLCLDTNLLASYIVPVPEIHGQLNVNHAFSLLMPLWVLLPTTFYSRENQGIGNLSKLSTTALFAHWSLHYSLRSLLINKMLLTTEQLIPAFRSDVFYLQTQGRGSASFLLTTISPLTGQAESSATLRGMSSLSSSGETTCGDSGSKD